MSFPIRSPRETISGIMVFGRILDKIRLHADDKLPEGYHLGFISGKNTFDERICLFLGVSHQDLTERTLSGGSDEEIMEWCFQNSRKPDAQQIEVFNGFMEKRGWRDSASKGLEQRIKEAGFSHRSEIQTFCDLMDAEEGRI
jgi:Domain of unknown function (DUF5069)